MLSSVIFEGTVIRTLPIYWRGVVVFIFVVGIVAAADDDDDEGFTVGRGLILELWILSASHLSL